MNKIVLLGAVCAFVMGAASGWGSPASGSGGCFEGTFGQEPSGEVVSYCLLYDGALKQAIRYDVRRVDSRAPIWASLFTAAANWNRAEELNVGAGITAIFETDMGFVIGVSAGLNFENLFRSEGVSGAFFVALGIGWRF